jgi:hypothetical protein
MSTPDPTRSFNLQPCDSFKERKSPIAFRELETRNKRRTLLFCLIGKLARNNEGRTIGRWSYPEKVVAESRNFNESKAIECLQSGVEGYHAIMQRGCLR